MLIEIQCENISSFDATVGKYVECGEKMIVSGEKAGETVECTKCNQPIEIPLSDERPDSLVRRGFTDRRC